MRVFTILVVNELKCFFVFCYCSYTEDEELQNFADTPIPDDPQLNPPIPFEEGIISFAGKIYPCIFTLYY